MILCQVFTHSLCSIDTDLLHYYLLFSEVLLKGGQKQHNLSHLQSAYVTLQQGVPQVNYLMHVCVSVCASVHVCIFVKMYFVSSGGTCRAYSCMNRIKSRNHWCGAALGTAQPEGMLLFLMLLV